MAEEKAAKKALPEVVLWASPTYRITFDRANGEMVYRVKIPLEKLRRMGV